MKNIGLFLVIGLLLIGIFAVSIAYADKPEKTDKKSDTSSSTETSGDDSDSEDDDTDSDDDDSEDDEDEEEAKKGNTKQTQTYTFTNNEGEEYHVTVRTETKTKAGETYEKVKVRGLSVTGADGETIQLKLSNGNNQNIKVMPETASQTAIDKLGSKNVDIVLRERGKGDKLRVVYEASAEKQVKFLGLFKINTQFTAYIDPDTGEVIELQKPWWSFLAFGQEEVEEPPTNQTEPGNETEPTCETIAECNIPAVEPWYNCEDEEESCLNTPTVECVNNTCVSGTYIECSLCDISCEETTGMCVELPDGNETEPPVGNDTNSTL